MVVPKTLVVASFLLIAGCFHRETTGEEHRQAAAADVSAAERERAKYDPNQTAREITPRAPPSAENPGPQNTYYNPTAAHLAQADLMMASAFRHLEAARKLEKFEDVACKGISIAERTSCPLIAPHVEQIEEGSRGIVLHLKTAERAKTLAIQMQCHLAFAQANNFDRSPCPLYMKGVAITLTGDKAIEVVSGDAAVASLVRQEARKMFGEPANTVSLR